MAFSHGVVVVVIDQNNRPIREVSRDGRRTAFMPFGTEYKLRIKNNNNFRCKAQILIDGTDVMFGSKLVLNAYESTDIERFVESNDKGRKFKFTSLEQAAATGELADPTSPDNGRIQVIVEQEWPHLVSGWVTYSTGYGGCINTAAVNSRSMSTPIGASGGGTSGAGSGGHLSSQGVGVTLDCALNSNSTPIQSSYHVNSQPTTRGHVGVTAEGGESSQKFASVTDFYCIPLCTIDIWLRAPEHVAQQPTIAPQGWAIKWTGKIPIVYLNGAPFPGNYRVVVDDGELKLNGTGINIATRDFAVF